MAEDSVNLIQGEMVELHDLGFGPQTGRHNRTSLFLTLNFSNDPCFVLAVHAPPVSMREEMEPVLRKISTTRAQATRSGLCGTSMRNLAIGRNFL